MQEVFMQQLCSWPYDPGRQNGQKGQVFDHTEGKRHSRSPRARLRLQAAGNCNARLQPISKQDREETTLSPWPSLDLQELYKEAGGGRVRQHVNPLKSRFQTPARPPDWEMVYANPSLPLVLDIGCAAGRFLLEMAERLPDRNFLGLDIREPHIERALKWAQNSQKEGQLHFQYANATVSTHSILASYPAAINLVCIQFPDPHFKTRHKKRQIVQPQLVTDLAKLMAPGGQVFLQSDIESVTAEMRDTFEEFGHEYFDLADHHESTLGCGNQQLAAKVSSEDRSPASCRSGLHAYQMPAPETQAGCFNKGKWSQAGFLVSNPLGVVTEREFNTTNEGHPVYRVMLTHKR